MLVKLKEYARSKKLDGDANKGKQALDLSRVQNRADEEVVQDGEDDGDEDGSLNKVTDKCYFCQKKGHSITQCSLVNNLKGKGKGEHGKGSKGEGKGGDGKEKA